MCFSCDLVCDLALWKVLYLMNFIYSAYLLYYFLTQSASLVAIPTGREIVNTTVYTQRTSLAHCSAPYWWTRRTTARRQTGLCIAAEIR